MNLENQVCSLELSKRLKELGVLQNSLFWWLKRKDYPKAHLVFGMPNFSYKDDFNNLTYSSPIWEITGWEFYSAFTVAELGEILFQKNAEHLEEMGFLDIQTEKIYRSTGDFYRITNDQTDHIIDELIEADARAKMLIYILENKSMELQNERIK